MIVRHVFCPIIVGLNIRKQSYNQGTLLVWSTYYLILIAGSMIVDPDPWIKYHKRAAQWRWQGK